MIDQRKQYPKSTPDIGQHNIRRYPRRQSRKHRQSRQYEFKIQNPFKIGQQQNFIPPQLKEQMKNDEYISTKSIRKIQLPQSKRTSSFIKNLKMMQQVAKQQEQKFVVILNSKKQIQKIEQLPPMKINSDDQVSLQLNGFYDYKERIEDDFNIFSNDEMQNQDILFYSNQLIEQRKIDEELENYLT